MNNQGGAGPQGKTVLLADASAALLTCVGGALRDAGYSVRKASSAAEALDILAAEPVQLLVAASDLPGMSGPDLAAKAWESMPDLPVVLMTGYVGTERAAYHPALVVTRPFTPNVILETAAQALGRRARPAG